LKNHPIDIITQSKFKLYTGLASLYIIRTPAKFENSDMYSNYTLFPYRCQKVISVISLISYGFTFEHCTQAHAFHHLMAHSITMTFFRLTNSFLRTFVKCHSFKKTYAITDINLLGSHYMRIPFNLDKYDISTKLCPISKLKILSFEVVWYKTFD